MMNTTRPDCLNCGATEAGCEAALTYRGRTCCDECDHPFGTPAGGGYPEHVAHDLADTPALSPYLSAASVVTLRSRFPETGSAQGERS